MNWSCSKQRRISHSSYGAEIITCADADNRGYYIKKEVQTILPEVRIRHELNVDSRGLYDTITKLHEGKEYRMRQTVLRIRESFESEELDILQLIQGFFNLTDALTKQNSASFKMLTKELAKEYLEFPKHDSCALESAEWK